MYRSDDEYREIIFNQWFDKQTNKYEMMREGKFCDIGITIKYAPFISTFNKVYRSNMRYYDTRQDCYSDCIALVWEGMIKFRIKNDSSWEEIANKKDMDNYKKLVNYLKTHVIQNSKKLTHDYAKTCKSIKNGKSKKILHIFYNITSESLNQITTFDNSLEKVEMVDTVTDSYWVKKANYQYDIFSEWAKENLFKYITKSQKKLLCTLRDANYSSFDNDYDKDKVGMNKGQVRLKLDRIRDKVTAKYCKEQKYITGGYTVKIINAEIKAYQKFINVLNNEETSLLDESLTRIILNSMNNAHWERLIYEDISDNAQKDIIRVYQADTIIYEKNFKLYNNKTIIKRKTLYEVVNAISKRIEFLIKMREYEMSILEKEATKNKVKVKQMQYKVPENYDIIYMSVNPNGIMIQK